MRSDNDHGIFTKKLALVSLFVAQLQWGCGQNLYKSTEKKDPAEDATLALEDKKPDKAISILEGALDGNSDQPELWSILALAYAQRAGIEPLEFAKRMSEKSASSTSSNATAATGGFTSMFDIMPEATTQNVSDVDYAVEILTTKISPDEQLPGDVFKLAIYQTASVVLHTKALDADLSGNLSAAEIADLSTTDAATLLSQITNANTLLASQDQSDPATAQAAAAIAQYQTQIDAEPGATDDEKLRNFLADKQSGGTP